MFSDPEMRHETEITIYIIVYKGVKTSVHFYVTTISTTTCKCANT